MRLAVELGAQSVDHVAFVSSDEIAMLAESWKTDARGTVATVLPACDLSTRMPLAPARDLLDAGAVVAIASNANPGTSYTTSMGFCVATAVLQMRLTVAEAVRAATLGGAIALGLDGEIGRVRVGDRADLQMLDAPSVTHLAYRPGVPLTSAVWRSGLATASSPHDRSRSSVSKGSSALTRVSPNGENSLSTALQKERNVRKGVETTPFHIFRVDSLLLE